MSEGGVGVGGGGGEGHEFCLFGARTHVCCLLQELIGKVGWRGEGGERGRRRGIVHVAWCCELGSETPAMQAEVG